MAVVEIEGQGVRIEDPAEAARTLAGIGITYERWRPSRPLAEDASAEDVLEAYSAEIERLKASGGYVTADVIDVRPTTPGLEPMLEKFRREHWHDEDEVRFVLAGRGRFYLHPPGGKVVTVEVVPGDLLRVPRGTWHWFTLCAERRIRAIRLFQDPSGWSPQYTGSGVDGRFAPVCFGPSHVEASAPGVGGKGPVTPR